MPLEQNPKLKDFMANDDFTEIFSLPKEIEHVLGEMKTDSGVHVYGPPNFMEVSFYSVSILFITMKNIV